jgi:hypothetical protein
METAQFLFHTVPVEHLEVVDVSREKHLLRLKYTSP